MIRYVTKGPGALNGAYVKATSTNQSGYYSSIYITDPYMPLTGSQTYTSWISNYDPVLPIKINIDHGGPFVTQRIYIENFHGSGTSTEYGVRNIRIYGTNSSTAFDNLTGTDLTDLVLLSDTILREHISSDVSDPQYIDVSSNTVAYRYTVLVLVDGLNPLRWIGLRRIEMQMMRDQEYIVLTHSLKIDTVAVKSVYRLTPGIHFSRLVKNVGNSIKRLSKTIFSKSFNVVPLISAAERKGVTFNLTKKHRLPIWTSYLQPPYTSTNFTDTFGSISGTVRVDGELWRGALVRLHFKENGILIDQCLSDHRGRFKFDFLEKGKPLYTVLAYKDGFNAVVMDSVRPIPTIY